MHWYNIAKFKIITCNLLLVAGLNRCFNLGIVIKCDFDCNATSNTTLSLQITIRLGRALKKGEYRVKVYQLLVNEPEVRSCK